MPKIYLSPSTQEYNPYVTGNGSEEYFMNLVADAMEPYLLANGIQFSRNTPDMTAASSIRQAIRGDYDFYLALHSNASGPGSEGQNRGIIALFYPTSRNGRRGAEIIARNLQEIYPLPERVVTRSTTSLGEVRQPRAPAVLKWVRARFPLLDHPPPICKPSTRGSRLPKIRPAPFRSDRGR